MSVIWTRRPSGNKYPNSSVHHFNYTCTPVAAAAASVLSAQALPASGTTLVTSFLAQPDVPRVLTFVGSAATVTGNAVVVGTNGYGDTISETFALNGTSTVTGTKAFNTVTSITVPVRVAGGETVNVGIGSKLGIPDMLYYDTASQGFVNGTREATRPVITPDGDELEKNLVTFTSSLAGTEVVVTYVVM